MPDALTDAARLLIAEASPATVRAVLKLLIDDLAPAPPTPVRAVQAPTPSPARPARKRAVRHVPPANGVDAAWEQLRREAREVMRTRGVSYAVLGAALGLSATSAKINLSRRRQPSARVLAALQAWLGQSAPELAEVAERAAPFRSSGTDQHSQNNGAGRSASAAARTAGNGSHAAAAVARAPTGTPAA